MSPALAERLRRSSVEVRDGRQGGGSGIVWSSGGLVITNAHVVHSNQPMLRFSDHGELAARVLALDRKRDLALLQVDANGLAAAEIGDSSRLRAGQIVHAVGNPFGMVGVFTTGIIHTVDPRANPQWIQADVRLAPGNSGGILADAEGLVIGVNTMIYAGLALAVPIDAAAGFVRQARARAA